MKKEYITTIQIAIFNFMLSSCTTVTYPNGTTVTTPYVAPACPTYNTGYYNAPYGTGGFYGGGYYPVYRYGWGWGGWGYGRCWNGGWNGCYRGNCWNGGYRPVCTSYGVATWNGYRCR